ncbi:serine/threonine-protein kinase [Catellatospora coxensis]
MRLVDGSSGFRRADGGTADDPVTGVSPLTSHDPRALGPYRLLGRLGKGGQGVVYLGADGSERRVAVKTINVDLQHNPGPRRSSPRRSRPPGGSPVFCTAQILHAEIDTELPYVVSEYIAGPTLHKQVRDHGPLADNALYRLAVGTATALAAIHQAGIVHCDFKPDNVILGGDGPRVIDFGIARALGAETMSGHVMGTVPYMAPERFHNVDVGPACDIFGWAATIGFASSGRGPFGHDSMATVMARVLTDPPDLDNLTGTLRELVVACLAKDQHARPTAQQVLMRLLGHEATPAAPLPLVEALQEGSEAATALVQPGPDSPPPPLPRRRSPPRSRPRPLDSRRRRPLQRPPRTRPRPPTPRHHRHRLRSPQPPRSWAGQPSPRRGCRPIPTRCRRNSRQCRSLRPPGPVPALGGHAAAGGRPGRAAARHRGPGFPVAAAGAAGRRPARHHHRAGAGRGRLRGRVRALGAARHRRGRRRRRLRRGLPGPAVHRRRARRRPARPR